LTINGTAYTLVFQGAIATNAPLEYEFKPMVLKYNKASSTGDTIKAMDPASGKTTRSLDVAAHAGTAFDGKHLFQIAEDRIQKVDPMTGRVLTTTDLVKGENIFFCATGVTDGELVKGVRYYGGGATTQSIVMRSKSGTVRMVEAYHRLKKLSEFTSIDFHGVAGAVPPMP